METQEFTALGKFDIASSEGGYKDRTVSVSVPISASSHRDAYASVIDGHHDDALVDALLERHPECGDFTKVRYAFVKRDVVED